MKLKYNIDSRSKLALNQETQFQSYTTVYQFFDDLFFQTFSFDKFKKFPYVIRSGID